MMLNIVKYGFWDSVNNTYINIFTVCILYMCYAYLQIIVYTVCVSVHVTIYRSYDLLGDRPHNVGCDQSPL